MSIDVCKSAASLEASMVLSAVASLFRGDSALAEAMRAGGCLGVLGRKERNKGELDLPVTSKILSQ